MCLALLPHVTQLALTQEWMSTARIVLIGTANAREAAQALIRRMSFVREYQRASPFTPPTRNNPSLPERWLPDSCMCSQSAMFWRVAARSPEALRG
jgi:hypothetical protein